MMTNKLRLSAASAAMAVLAACSGGPNQSQIKEALAADGLFMNGLEAASRMEAMMTGGAAQSADQFLASATIEQRNCTAAGGTPGQVCEFRFGRDVGSGMQFGPWTKARFFETEGGWGYQAVN